MIKTVTQSIVALAALMLAASTNAAVLYDASPNATPESQGWLTYYSLGAGTGTRNIAGGTMTYDSGATNAERGGVSSHTLFGSPANAAFPVLDRTAGFTVSVDLRLLSEEHATANRSGVSLLVLSSDHMGIELAFWGDEIWAQSGPDFVHAEGVARTTTAAGALSNGHTRYDLTLSGSTYTLSADGTPILSNALRDYSSFGFPYTLTNYLFLGDNTGSARGSFELSRLAVAIPEPGAAVALMVLAPLFTGRTRRR